MTALDFNDAAGTRPAPAAPALPARRWSDHQQAVFDAVRAGVDNLIVEAVAGSGKTTTIVEACRVVRDAHRREPLFLAFNKSIATELSGRGVRAATLHSLGFKALGRAVDGRLEIDGRKTRKVIADVTGSSHLGEVDLAAMKLVSIAKTYGIVPDGFGMAGLLPDDDATWAGLADHHDVDVEEDRLPLAIDLARDVLRASFRVERVIDFDDMLYLPVVAGLPFPDEAWTFVDEAQDVSGIQLAMLERLARRGRIVAVGDRAQAIYGFRGADTRALDAFADSFSARRLPLSITYRCARLIVEEARRLVPHIEAAPGAPDGRIERMASLPADLTAEDLVVCRRNAPLLEHAYELIGAGIPAVLVGRDVAEGLAATLEQMPKRGSLVDRIKAWAERKVRIALARDDDDAAERARDRAECLKVVVARAKAETVDDVRHHVAQLFGDGNAGRKVRLSSIHKAKGLEADRTLIIDAAGFQASHPWQVQQERNLKYVAITRAKTRLVHVGS